MHHLHTVAAAEEHVHDDGGHDDRLCNAVPRRGGYAAPGWPLPVGGAGVLSCGVDGNVPLEQAGDIHKPMEGSSGKRLSADTVPVRIGQRRPIRQGA